MPGALLIWWTALCAISMINLVAWAYCARTLQPQRGLLAADTFAARRWLLWLSAAYVLGCAFRSVLPMIDVPRTCLHDSLLSRIAVGRSVATAAELCFVAQWALLLREGAMATGNRAARLAAYAIIPIIVVAETFSWLAVLASNYLFHAAENSLWAAAALITVAAGAILRPLLDNAGRRFLAAVTVAGIVYVLFMVAVDVPMYLSRWQADLAAGRQPMTIAEGLGEILRRCNVVWEWSAWRTDATWLFLYFSVAVWISIGLVRAPPLRPA